MSKRFTDTNKWERPWFRNLPLKYKTLWFYVLDRCDNAGFWYVDFGLAEYMTKCKFDKQEASGLFSKQIKVLNGRWFIKDFAEFQYGSFRDSSNAFHKKLVKQIDTVLDTVSDTVVTTVQVQEQEQDKEQDKDKESDRPKKDKTEIPHDLEESRGEILDWLEYKKQRGESYKPRGLLALWGKIRDIPVSTRRESINASMSNNWSGLFRAKNNPAVLQNKKQTEVVI